MLHKIIAQNNSVAWLTSKARHAAINRLGALLRPLYRVGMGEIFLCVKLLREQLMAKIIRIYFVQKVSRHFDMWARAITNSVRFKPSEPRHTKIRHDDFRSKTFVRFKNHGIQIRSK